MLTARILVYIVSQQVAFRIVRTESACTINVALLDRGGSRPTAYRTASHSF